MKWAIAYINNKHGESLEPGFLKLGIDYELGIPYIQILRKRFKNKKYFEKIPLLFNYGFIKLPLRYLQSRELLIDIKNKIPGIYSWMYKESGEDKIIVETVTDKEVKRLYKKCNELSIFSPEDIIRFGTGDYIILKGYPFEGLGAQIKTINHKSKRITVNIFIMNSVREVEVSYENIFYSIYENFDDTPSSKSIDEMEFKNKGSRDRIEFKKDKYGSSR